MKTLLCSSTTEFELGQCFDHAKAHLTTAEAVLLTTQLLEVSFTELHTEPERIVSHFDVERLDDAIQRRLSGEPIAYITGSKMFRTLNISVTPDVLIPRFETELLVDIVAELTPSTGRVLDLGTGSGAIAIALSTAHDMQVVAVDNSESALQICAENCKKHKANVEIVHSNWFDRINGNFDTIVSNPPYVAANDPHLYEGDLRFEPPTALVGGNRGLEHLEAIIDAAFLFLNSDGWLVVEHGYAQQDSVKKLFVDRGYTNIQTRRDYAGTHRFLWGQSRGG